MAQPKSVYNMITPQIIITTPQIPITLTVASLSVTSAIDFLLLLNPYSIVETDELSRELSSSKAIKRSEMSAILQ